MSRRPAAVGDVLTGVDWDRWSVILLKPDCVRRGLVDTVLERISDVVSVHGRMDVPVADWQIHVHYWDLLVGADWLDCDIPACLRGMYIDRRVTVALAHGPAGTPALVRELLGHFDPAQAAKGTLRGDLGTDNLTAARAQGRLVENLVHASDDATATCRDFGTWYGAKRHHLLGP
ncbi:nucleoside-diphosphate kinase [Streptomyces sp. NBC_00658]|uniref:nucleoside-diphosphate kinase n=1 Tax=Streptomyces sp. NBC_00658 TaxID=2975800 RepID=UPI0032553860